MTKPCDHSTPMNLNLDLSRLSRRSWLGLSLAGAATVAMAPVTAPAQTGFDHGYAAWNALLKRHVRWLPDGKQSQVDYRGFAADRAALKQVLDALSGVSQASFDGWSKPQQMAFLINAYNAFTVELILTRYPDLKSIKDLGSLLQTPWKKKFFTLLGEQRHLDWVEHEQLRPRYQEPRIHAAVNCASIGCPALRDEAFTADRLEAQLEDGMRRFMADRTRNRAQGDRVEVSMIFRWFREDFEQGHRGWRRVEDVTAQYAELLTDDPALRDRLRRRDLRVAYLDYDWSLNDQRR
jgi:Protein of unknown function, DUF547